MGVGTGVQVPSRGTGMQGHRVSDKQGAEGCVDEEGCRGGY